MQHLLTSPDQESRQASVCHAQVGSKVALSPDRKACTNLLGTSGQVMCNPLTQGCVANAARLRAARCVAIDHVVQLGFPATKQL